MGSLQHSMATLFNRNHGTHEESSPQGGSSNKALINPIWKFRILAILAICVLVIPGNIVTLSIYLTSEGPSNTNSSCSTNSSFYNDTDYHDSMSNICSGNDTDYMYDEDDEIMDLLSDDETDKSNENDTIVIDDGNASTYQTTAGYYCHEKFDLINPVLDSVSFWIEGVSLTIVAIVGLLGNLLTVIVLPKLDRGPPNISRGNGGGAFNKVLISLVAFDSFFLVYSLFDESYLRSFHMPEPYWYKVIFPYFWYPFKNVVTSGCVFMVVAVAAERYFAICKPLTLKPKPIFFISLVVIASVVINVPKFFEFEYKYLNGSLQYWTSDLNENATYVVFSSYYECGVIGVIPLIALCYLNYKIYKKVNQSTENMKNLRHVGGQSSCIVRRNKELKTSEPLINQIPLIELREINRSSRLSIELSVLPQEPQVNEYGRSRSTLVPNSYSNMSVRSEYSPRGKTSVGLINGHTSQSASKIESIRRCSNDNKVKGVFRKRQDKTTGILVGIILVFVLCHVFRLAIQIYEIVSPTHGLQDHYIECFKLKRLHVPAVVLIAGSVNHLLLVVNSSMNFLIYCCMAKRFRKALLDVFRSWRCHWSGGSILQCWMPFDDLSKMDVNRYN